MQKTEIWYKAEGSCPTQDFELASYELFEAGVLTLEELDSNNPDITTFRFYTSDINERDRIVRAFPQFNFKTDEEPAKDWDKWWRDRAKPVFVSDRLCVRPPWVEFTPENKETVVLELEAKTAFGTGEHETTSSTASLMEKIDFNGKTVLDIGTGTGILAMFARRLGASLAVGTEIDPLALSCIAENFTRNGFKNSNAVLGFLDSFKDSTKFDVVTCNMIRSELWPMRDDIERLMKKGSRLVISGQLATEKFYVTDWFKEANLAIEEEIVKGEWWSVRAIQVADNE